MLKNHETRKRQSRNTNPTLAHSTAQILNHVYIILLQSIAGVGILYLPEHLPLQPPSRIAFPSPPPPRLGPSLPRTAAQDADIKSFPWYYRWSSVFYLWSFTHSDFC